MNSGKNLDSAYVKSYYDGFLSSYDGEYAHYRWQAGPVEKLHYLQTERALMPYLKCLQGDVLEIGGGDAVWTMLYVSNASHITFLDISEEMIARARKRLVKFSDKVNFINSDYLAADFSGKRFDHIVSIRNLEYFTDKETFMDRTHGLLKDEGSFVLVTKSPKYNLWDMAKEKTLHTCQIDILDLLALMRKSGFRIESVYPAIFGKLFRFGFTRWLSRALHKATLALPWNNTLLRMYSYLSESFVIYAKK